MFRYVFLLTGLVASITWPLSAQSAKSPLNKLSELGLPEVPGEVPVVYVKSAEERAIRLQKSLEAGHSWFQKQLHITVPIKLTVLDSEMWSKVSGYPYGPPHMFVSEGGPGLVVFFARPASVQAPPGPLVPGIDADHAVGGVLQGEHLLFHEDGHILATRLNIMRFPNHLVDELVASMIAASYISSERPDLNVFLGTARRAAQRPRYTSLADFNYLGMDVGGPNYVWLHGDIWRLATLMVKGQSFPNLVQKIQKSFPASEAQALTIEEIVARLERIQPGFLKAAGSLTDPSTITQTKPSPCPQSAKGSGVSHLVIQNDANEPLDITHPGGRIWRVTPHSWRSFGLPVGSALKLPDGSCLIGQDEPRLAVIGKR
jgi:hypothetical protein